MPLVRKASIESIVGGVKSWLVEYVTRPLICVQSRSTPVVVLPLVSVKNCPVARFTFCFCPSETSVGIFSGHDWSVKVGGGSSALVLSVGLTLSGVNGVLSWLVSVSMTTPCARRPGLSVRPAVSERYGCSGR